MSQDNVSLEARTASDDVAVLQYVIDNIPYLIFWKDRNSVYLGCNKNFAALDGKADPRALVGRTDFDMAWKEHAPLYRAGDEETMRRGEAILDKEEVSIDPDGNETVILTSKVPLRDARGEVVGLLGIIVDITARKQLELQLQRAKEEADQAAQAKSDFIANVSHELRTPLTLVLGPLGRVLENPEIDERSRRMLEGARRNAFRLYNLVNDVLDFSKAEAKHAHARNEPLDLIRELSTLVVDMRPLAELGKLTLELETDLDRLDTLLDPDFLERIMINLIGNAIKFTPHGGKVKVFVSAREDELCIVVSDTGVGIPQAAQATLFDKFTQVDDSTTRRHQGTGLGLALVKQFVEAMDGRVDVKSTEGEGSEFTLTFPWTRCEMANVAAPREVEDSPFGRRAWREQITQARAANDTARTTTDPSKPSVLIAEDNDELRQFMTEILSDDFAVVDVANGALAWEAISKHRFDVVVSDVMMPELDGIALLGKIKSHPALQTLPVILATARGGQDAMSHGLESGADDYISKPFAPEELLARVRAQHRMANLQQQLKERSRAASAEAATAGILHNIGNVLNNVNVSADLLQHRVSPSNALVLEKLSTLWAQASQDEASLRAFMASEEGVGFGKALERIAEQVKRDQQELSQESRSIVDNVAHATAIVARQIGQQRADVVSEPTELSALLQQAIRLSGDASRNGSDVPRIEVDTAEVPVLYTDPHVLLQVFVNLLTNARHAIAQAEARDEPGRIRIAAHVDGDELEVRVEDTGVGIAADHLPRLFQHGFTTRQAGHGLGLHFSALALQQLGGSLRGESKGPGQGATFICRVPIDRTTDSHRDADAPSFGLAAGAS